MQHVEVVRRYTASPEDVWRVYTDHSRWSEWAGFSRSWLETEGSPDRNGTGAVRALGSAGVTAFEEVLTFEPPHRMTYRVLRGGLPLRDHLGEVELRADGDGTLVVWRCRFASRIPGLGGLMRVYITHFFRTALDGLARHSFPDSAT